MTTREDVLKYCLSFPDTYQDAPFFRIFPRSVPGHSFRYSCILEGIMEKMPGVRI